MTTDATRAAALALLHRSRAEQQLPERVMDETVLAQVAALIARPPARPRHMRRRAS
jgi:hypothetical protein